MSRQGTAPPREGQAPFGSIGRGWSLRDWLRGHTERVVDRSLTEIYDR